MVVARDQGRDGGHCLMRTDFSLGKCKVLEMNSGGLHMNSGGLHNHVLNANALYI